MGEEKEFLNDVSIEAGVRNEDLWPFVGDDVRLVIGFVKMHMTWKIASHGGPRQERRHPSERSMNGDRQLEEKDRVPTESHGQPNWSRYRHLTSSSPCP